MSDNPRCGAFRRLRHHYTETRQTATLEALEQLFRKHQRRCEDCRQRKT